MNTSSDFIPVIFSKTPGVCEKEECIFETRITRNFIRLLKKKWTIWKIMVEYPHLMKEQIEAC